MNEVPYYPTADRPPEHLPEARAERVYGPRPHYIHYAMLIAWLLLQGFGLVPILLWKGPIGSYLAIFPPVLLIVSFFVCLLANLVIGKPVYRYWPRESPFWHPLVMVPLGGIVGMAVAFVALVLGFFCGGFLFYFIVGQGFGADLGLVGMGGPLAGGALTGAVWAWIVNILDRCWLARNTLPGKETEPGPGGPMPAKAPAKAAPVKASQPVWQRTHLHSFLGAATGWLVGGVWLLFTLPEKWFHPGADAMGLLFVVGLLLFSLLWLLVVIPLFRFWPRHPFWWHPLVVTATGCLVGVPFAALCYHLSAGLDQPTRAALLVMPCVIGLVAAPMSRWLEERQRLLHLRDLRP